ncbi:sensor histidine kinase [Limibacter armeniacum]|uniref:sensor histidine kinase n=1 Tax=Limibacter armeniacum TaxID=466084 RepID=UPI002FE696D9
MRIILGLCCLLLGFQFVHAQSSDLLFFSGLEETQSEENIPFILLEDSLQQLTPQDAREKLTAIADTAPQLMHFSSSRKVNYWLMVSITNPSHTTLHQTLKLSGWGEIDAWDFNSLEHLEQTGKLSLHANRLQKDAIPLLIHEQSSVTLLLKLSAKVSILEQEKAQVQLLPARTYELTQYRKQFIQTLFIGIILVMALYNLLIFLTIRDISYFYFVLSIAGIGLYMMFYHGLNLVFLWPKAPYWDAHSFTLIVPLTGVARTLFTRKYLHLREFLPAWDKALIWLTFAYIIPIGLGIVSYTTKWDFLQEATQAIGLIGATVLVSMIVTAFLVYRKGYIPAIYFMVANFLFVVGALLLILQEVSILPASSLISHSTQVGVVSQVILFSLGLADRFKRSQQEALERKLEKERLEKEKEREKQQLIAGQKAELKKQVEERTKELAEAVTQLQESEQSLKALNALKDRLFSIISHDLRSPLATFDSFLNLLLHHSHRLSQEEMKEIAAETNKSLQNLSDLLENLLQWSRAQLQENRYEESTFDIRELIDKNNTLYSSTAKEKGITLEMCIPEKPIIVRGDYRMLDFVIRNLINNAIKFTDSNGKVTAQVKLQDKKCLISIEDTGVGLSEEQIEMIKKAKGNYTTLGTKDEKGIGLGLMLCRDFLKIHTAQLQIKSTTGEGSIFGFELSPD